MSLTSSNANANLWLCSGIDKIPRMALKEAYQGNSILLNGKWLKIYLLPFDHPLTISTFAVEGISTAQVKRLSTNNSLVDRGFRIVPTVDVLASAMLLDTPSIGYSYSEVGSVKACRFTD
jgi:hypothetical protein